MKRIACAVLSVLFIILAALSATAFTMQSSRSFSCADSSGAYVVSISGVHVDIVRYASQTYSAGVDLSYRISAVCASHGKVVFFCDDSDNNQLIVYVYDCGSDTLDSFAVYGAKLYGSTDFACDTNAIYLENHRDSHELKAYSYSGSLMNTYRFSDEITSVFGGNRSGVYAVGGDTLYSLSGNGFTAVNGASVETPMFPADSDIIASVYGDVYLLDGNSITDTLTVESDYHAASACVIDGILYYPCGNTINAYDTDTGDKVGYYKCSDSVKLVYAAENNILAVSNTSCTAVSTNAFTSLRNPDTLLDRDVSPDTPINKFDSNDGISVSKISSEVYQVDDQHYWISGISPETTVAQFKRNMRYDGYSLTIYRDNTEKSGGNVGTAMTAVFTAGNSSITYELAVDGDLTGEGSRNSRDLTLLMDYLIGAADFNGVYEIAADLSGDGMVDVTDLALLKGLV